MQLQCIAVDLELLLFVIVKKFVICNHSLLFGRPLTLAQTRVDLMLIFQTWNYPIIKVAGETGRHSLTRRWGIPSQRFVVVRRVVSTVQTATKMRMVEDRCTLYSQLRLSSECLRLSSEFLRTGVQPIKIGLRMLQSGSAHVLQTDWLTRGMDDYALDPGVHAWPANANSATPLAASLLSTTIPWAALAAHNRSIDIGPTI